VGIALYEIPNPTGGRLCTMARPRGDDWLHDEMADLRDSGIDVLVSLQPATERHEVGLTGEPEAAAHAGLVFRELPIPDLGVPGQREALPLVRAIAGDLEAGRNVAIHCFAGVGRSSVLAGAVLVALGETPDEAWRVIAAARGRRVPETDEQTAWLADWALTWRAAAAH
jgi:protein-tyrosine phosphatase